MTKKYDRQPEWNYTEAAGDIEAINKLMTDKRHRIGRDTSVLNGIYTGAYGGEALVVDYDTMTEYYDRIADTVIDRSLDTNGSPDKSKILNSVFDVVTELLPYSMEGVAGVNERYDIEDFEKVSLIKYIEEKAGVCRHQALLVAAIIEIIKNRGILNGTASVNRNTQWTEEGDREGHAWVRYTAAKGQVYILDVAHPFIGTLEQSRQIDKGWNYFRPEELDEQTLILPIDTENISKSGLARRALKKLRK